MVRKPITTDGIASSSSGTVTTQGDSCGSVVVLVPWCSSPAVVVVAARGAGRRGVVRGGFWSKRSLPWKTRKYMRNE